MSKTQRYLIICWLVAVLVQPMSPRAASADSSQPPSNAGIPPVSPSSQPYAAGRVLVRFRQGSPPASASALLTAYDAEVRGRIAEQTYAVSVPVGREEELVKQFRKHPAVASAMLDLRLVTPPLEMLETPAGDTPSFSPDLLQASQGVLTETLRMSASPAGPPLPDHTLPTESPLVYVVFDYAGLDQAQIRVQVYSLDTAPSPVVLFDEVETFDESGTASIVVPASDYFVDQGTFPIGRYLTLVSESVSGSWRPVGTVEWHVSTQPNDRWFLSDRYQWNLHNSGKWGTRDADIDAPEAWDVTTGSSEVAIAIISSGVALNHPDLQNKIWKNQGEIPGNQIDDDGNGYVDDVHGYEFFQDDDNPDPGDDIGWGTFAAGIVGAETNNRIGMAGVSWGGRIMPIKVVRLLATQDGQVPYGFISDLIQGIYYAADNGARVILVAPLVYAADFEDVELLRQAVEYATDQGSLVVGIVGDQGADDAVWPALFPEVLGVGATDNNDQLVDFSNFGEAVSDGVVAPGKLILSTCMSYLPACVADYQIDVHGQTAWAAAQVAGVASLVWSVNAELSPGQVRRRLTETADDLGPPGQDQLHGYGRLNAGRAVRWTRHLLHLDIPELYFLVDDQDSGVCRTIRNHMTGPFSWSASEEVDWLQVSGPTGAFTPSQLEVCVVRSALRDYDTYTATLTLLSTIDTQTEPVTVPVVVEYIPRKSRVFVPVVSR